jgi:Asp-tRNA(Asn)/Glu-tRNA(Gln) amidotransferase A subunit family amidase
VAAGLVPFAIGSETLGSIVSPCTRNAVTGLRPTYGRVSRAGAMALVWSTDKLGPIARSAGDCALVFDTLHGVDPADPTTVDAPFAWPPRDRLRGERIGYLADAFAAAGEWHDANQAVLATLQSLGAELVPIALPPVSLPALRIIYDVEEAAAFDDLTLSGAVDDLIAPQPSNWANSMRAARFIPAVEYIQANRLRTLLIRDLEQTLAAANAEVWIAPQGASANLVITNLTGHPTVCAPAGFAPVKDQPADSPRRNATSITFNARLYRDDRALAVAHAFQQATDWHRRRPPIA